MRRIPGFVAGIVFGSVARGDATPWSDVDLGVLATEPVALGERLGLMADAATILGRDVDVVDLRTASLPLCGMAIREGRALVVADREAFADFSAATTIAWLDYERLYRHGVALELEHLRARGSAA